MWVEWNNSVATISFKRFYWFVCVFSTSVNPTDLICSYVKSINLLSRTLIRSKCLSTSVGFSTFGAFCLILLLLVNHPKQIGISTSLFSTVVQVDLTATVNVEIKNLSLMDQSEYLRMVLCSAWWRISLRSMTSNFRKLLFSWLLLPPKHSRTSDIKVSTLRSILVSFIPQSVFTTLN